MVFSYKRRNRKFLLIIIQAKQILPTKVKTMRNYYRRFTLLHRNLQFWFLVLLIGALYVLQGSSVFACVGRKLQVGYKNYTEQRILAEMLAILVRERTGTNVTLVAFNSTNAAYKAIQAGEIQVFVEYTGIGLRDVLGGDPKGNKQHVYQNVKKAYEQIYNLVWLKPFGFQTTYKYYQKDVKAGIPMEAAPIVKRETLRKFPALARLINKLAGKIDDATISNLIAKADKNGERPEDIAGTFLKKLNISFNFIPGKG
jgi:osmoprotectant transport system substrate-binding protein